MDNETKGQVNIKYIHATENRFDPMVDETINFQVKFILKQKWIPDSQVSYKYYSTVTYSYSLDTDTQ